MSVRGRLLGDLPNAPAGGEEFAVPTLVVAVLDPLDRCQRLPDISEAVIDRAECQAGLEVELIVLEPADDRSLGPRPGDYVGWSPARPI